MKRLLPVLAAAALWCAPVRAEEKVHLGLQTWSCNKMSFEQVVDFATRHEIKYLQFIASHMDPRGPVEENARKKEVLAAKGIVPYTFGVNRTTMDKEDNRKLFEFAKLIGAKLIIVEPRNLEEWDNLEALVKEYDIKLAIHNHGRGTVYGDPATVKEILAKRDKRIGVCLDIGWITAAEFDAAKVFREYGDRVFDLHFKDKKLVPGADGKTDITDVIPGTGDAPYRELFAEIKRSGWTGVMAIETDNKEFQADPEALVTAAKAFFKAHMAGHGHAH